jgi:serine/threonine protein kinase
MTENGEQRCFYVKALLGGGTFGTTYQAEHSPPSGGDETVAIKVFNDTKPNGMKSARTPWKNCKMEYEIGSLVSQCSTNASPTYYEVGEVTHIDGEDCTIGQVWVIVMECVHGRTFKDILRDESTPPGEILRNICAIAVGLKELQQKYKFEHRDFKADNFMFKSTGDGTAETSDRPGFIDFGLSRTSKHYQGRREDAFNPTTDMAYMIVSMEKFYGLTERVPALKGIWLELGWQLTQLRDSRKLDLTFNQAQCLPAKQNDDWNCYAKDFHRIFTRLLWEGIYVECMDPTNFALTMSGTCKEEEDCGKRKRKRDEEEEEHSNVQFSRCAPDAVPQ